MAIYTKRGDRGETSLYNADNSQRIKVFKSSLRIEAIGATDELNSYLGTINLDLSHIQKNLFTIGSILAGSNLRFYKSQTTKLEKEIDRIEGTLPVLKNFILPKGPLHYARSLTRKAERKMVALNDVEKIKPQILVYINRLSDYFFMLSRKINKEKGIKENIWRARKV